MWAGGASVDHAERPRTVLLVNEQLAGGGAERQLIHIAEHLAAAGDRVMIVTWASPQVPDAYPLPANLERLHLRRREPRRKAARIAATASTWLKLVNLIRRTRADIIISFSDVSNMLSTLASRATGVPIIVSIRADPDAVYALKPHWRRPALATYRRANTVVVQTEALAGWCQAVCGRAAVVIPNMMVLKSPVRSPMSGRERRVVSLASLDPRKGHDVLIRAFARARREAGDWTLRILGEGTERGRLEQLAAEEGIADRFELPGFDHSVADVLDRSSVFALASRFEGFPNALIEAMAMGMAAVATDSRYGPADIIDHGRNGLLVAVDDVDGLADALAQLMTDEELRERLGAAARSVRERYSPGTIMSLWRDTIAATIASRKR